MNSMLIIASLIAVAVATPMHRGLVSPGAAGPAPIIIEPTQPIAVGPTPIIDGPTIPIAVGPTPIIDGPTIPIAVGPTPIIDGPTVPIAVGPTPIVDDSVPISIGGAVIDFEHVEDVPVELSPATPTGAPLVQIILNINAAGELVAAPVVNPAPVVTEVIAPSPVNVVDGPVVVSPIAVVAPEAGPVNIVDGADVAVPEVAPVAVGTPVLPEVVSPVAVGTPVLPTPVAVLPDMLN